MMDLLIFLRDFHGAPWTDRSRPSAASAPAPILRLMRTAREPRLRGGWERDRATGKPVARWSRDAVTSAPASRPRLARVLLPARRGRAPRPCHKAAA